jgi:hypothetical protein
MALASRTVYPVAGAQTTLKQLLSSSPSLTSDAPNPLDTPSVSRLNYLEHHLFPAFTTWSTIPFPALTTWSTYPFPAFTTWSTIRFLP